MDHSSGKPYYVNHVTKQSTWTREYRNHRKTHEEYGLASFGGSTSQRVLTIESRKGLVGVVLEQFQVCTQVTPERGIV